MVLSKGISFLWRKIEGQEYTTTTIFSLFLPTRSCLEAYQEQFISRSRARQLHEMDPEWIMVLILDGNSKHVSAHMEKKNRSVTGLEGLKQIK